MDKIMEATIRTAAEMGKLANCPTQLRPAEMGALLDEIDSLRAKLLHNKHVYLVGLRESPCPFCGAEAEVHYGPGGDIDYIQHQHQPGCQLME